MGMAQTLKSEMRTEKRIKTKKQTHPPSTQSNAADVPSVGKRKKRIGTLEVDEYQHARKPRVGSTAKRKKHTKLTEGGYPKSLKERSDSGH